MFDQVLPGNGKQLLESIVPLLGQDFYLAGGTGLALQLGHRVSVDFDFFTPKTFDNNTLKQQLSEISPLQVSSETKGTLHGMFKSTRVSFLSYNYPLLYPLKEYFGAAIADYREIALMKITAISSRGSKKDFIDLFFACQQTPINDLFKKFDAKYSESGYSKYHLIKSLTYFEDAETEPDPVMLRNWDWETIKTYFRTAAPGLLKFI